MSTPEQISRLARGGTPASGREIFRFWLPLAAQWVMMASEGPFLAAVIARTPDPAFNLAAYGVSFAFAILIESPVIMLMSAATALVDDHASYRRLRAFATALNVGCTALLLIVLVPPVHATLMRDLLGLPDAVADLVYGSLWLLLPWPAAIGYRRFLHGVLIRAGQTRRVALGTLVRLVGMSVTAAVLFVVTDLPGAWIGAAALSAGVSVEAVVARVMAGGVLADLAGADDGKPPPTYGEVTRFYYPLALTSFLGLTVHPMLTFFMGRAPSPLASLAVFPVVHSLSFVFRAFGFSFQEVVIALVGRHPGNVPRLARFGGLLALAASGGLALVAFTPLATVWFVTVSGLTDPLAAMAFVPAQVSVALPALAVFLAFQHGMLVHRRTTRPVTAATLVEVVTIAVLFGLFGWWIGLTGVTSAVLALAGGRLAGNLYLVRAVTGIAGQAA